MNDLSVSDLQQVVLLQPVERISAIQALGDKSNCADDAAEVLLGLLYRNLGVPAQLEICRSLSNLRSYLSSDKDMAVFVCLQNIARYSTSVSVVEAATRAISTDDDNFRVLLSQINDARHGVSLARF